MNYQLIYSKLISKAQSRGKPEERFEKHHIIPSSLGGSNNKANLVCLTLREHYIAHILLFKIQTDKISKIKMSIP